MDRQGEAVGGAPRGAWKRSDFESTALLRGGRLPLKAFGNWLAKFEADPSRPERNCFTGVGIVTP